MKKWNENDNQLNCCLCLVPLLLLNPHEAASFFNSSISLSLDTSPTSNATLENNMLYLLKKITSVPHSAVLFNLPL